MFNLMTFFLSYHRCCKHHSCIYQYSRYFVYPDLQFDVNLQTHDLLISEFVVNSSLRRVPLFMIGSWFSLAKDWGRNENRWTLRSSENQTDEVVESFLFRL